MQALPVQRHRAGRRTIQTSTQAQEGCFATARRPNDSAGRTRGERKRDILEDSEEASSGVIGFTDILHVEKRSCLHMPYIACLLLFLGLVHMPGMPLAAAGN